MISNKYLFPIAKLGKEHLACYSKTLSVQSLDGILLDRGLVKKIHRFEICFGIGEREKQARRELSDRWKDLFLSSFCFAH